MHDSFHVTQAFRAGKYGPAFLSPSAEVQGLLDDGFPILADLRVMYPSRHDRVTAANERFVNEHPDLLRAFLRGMIRSCRYVLEPSNRDPFRATMVQAGFLESQQAQESFDDLFGGWQTRGTRDMALPRDGVELIAAEEKKSGRLSPSFGVDQVLRLEVLAQAQLALAESGTASPA
jgi:ABC-type nitrate/sulfonate/bicarbonate transport system substrate-binding protein